MSGRALLIIGVLIFAAIVSQGGGGIVPMPVSKVTEAVYVYEQREHPIPSGVMSGINRLNRERKIVATVVDKDVKNGNGETPSQYKIPFASAIEAGLPALVVMAGDTVRRVVKAPKTEQEVWEAAQ